MVRFFITTILLLITVFLTGCSGFFFYPDRIQYSTPKELGLTYEEIHIEDKDQPTLVGWIIPSATHKALIVHLHGNAENMSSHIASVYWLPNEGYDLLLADYRGYGASAGTPSLSGINRDCSRILRYAQKLAKERHEPLILLGQSIGATMGLYAASKPEFASAFAAIISDSAFSSYRSIAQEKISQFWITQFFGYPFLFTISDRFSPLGHMKDIHTPLFFIYDDKDPIVEAHHSEWLYSEANEPKQFLRIAKAEHASALKDIENRKKLLDFLRKYAKQTTSN